MTKRTVIITLLIFVCLRTGFALESNQILVLANRQIPTSQRIAEYYCEQRNIPKSNIIYLSLGNNLRETISRDEYENSVVLPIRRYLQRRISSLTRCLVTTYGVPIKVGPKGLSPGMGGKLKELRRLLSEEKQKLDQLKQDLAKNPGQMSIQTKQINRQIFQLQYEIGNISGEESSASVDSELSMVLFPSYNLYRWQPNILREQMSGIGFNTLMVSRLDGPNYKTVKGIIDKALTAEQTGLNGNAYIDSRGIVSKDLFGIFDQSLRDLGNLIRSNIKMPIITEETEKLFQPGSCPQTAVYCGWYSLRKYVDAFDFVDGAIGFHIASLEAQQLRDPNSTNWCAAMLRDGITATMGAVDEPYLHSFPQPKEFFAELFKGNCLVEAYYRTKPFNSWQLVLIGDPLYRPFKTTIETGS